MRLKFKGTIKRKNGITLIALIVTIVILLILAGIAISQINNNGLFKNAKLAKNKYEVAKQDEENTLKQYNNEINIGTTREETITINTKEYTALLDKIKTLENNMTILYSNNDCTGYSKTQNIQIPSSSGMLYKLSDVPKNYKKLIITLAAVTTDSNKSQFWYPTCATIEYDVSKRSNNYKNLYERNRTYMGNYYIDWQVDIPYDSNNLNIHNYNNNWTFLGVFLFSVIGYK